MKLRAPEIIPKDWRKLVGILCGVFVIAGIFGFIYETVFYQINNGVATRRGTCFGPFIQLYSYGAWLIILACWRVRQKPWLVFLVSGGVCGVLEYIVGWALYTFGNGFRSWDYNTEIWNWGNIDGFVCFRSVFFFAMSGMLLMYVILPVLMWMSNKMKPKTFFILMLIPMVIALADCFYNDILVNFVPGLQRALLFYKDTGWYGIVDGANYLY